MWKNGFLMRNTLIHVTGLYMSISHKNTITTLSATSTAGTLSENAVHIQPIGKPELQHFKHEYK